MKFSLKIESGNAAFEPFADKETARILRDLADRIENTGDTEGVVRDINGNRVGEWDFELDDRTEETEGDAVECNDCGWDGVVESGENECPNCHSDGTLSWLFSEGNSDE